MAEVMTTTKRLEKAKSGKDARVDYFPTFRHEDTPPTQVTPLHRKGRRFPNHGKFWPADTAETIINQINNTTVVEEVEKPTEHVIDLEVAVASAVIRGITVSKQTTEFAIVTDADVSVVRIYVKGFNTDNVLATDPEANIGWVLVAETAESPCEFILEATTETVMVGALAINSKGIPAKFADMPTVSITLI